MLAHYEEVARHMVHDIEILYSRTSFWMSKREGEEGLLTRSDDCGISFDLDFVVGSLWPLSSYELHVAFRALTWFVRGHIRMHCTNVEIILNLLCNSWKFRNLVFGIILWRDRDAEQQQEHCCTEDLAH